MSLRRRIEKSEFLAARLATLAGWYLAFCNRTTKWQIAGLDDLTAALQDGPVLLVMWHERSVMGALHWPVDVAPLSSLYDSSPIGRISGRCKDGSACTRSRCRGNGRTGPRPAWC